MLIAALIGLVLCVGGVLQSRPTVVAPLIALVSFVGAANWLDKGLLPAAIVWAVVGLLYTRLTCLLGVPDARRRSLARVAAETTAWAWTAARATAAARRGR